MSVLEPPTCYECGHEYRYLGRDHHPGQCPRCFSHCVSPAGAVTVVADIEIPSEQRPPQVTVVAIDDRSRHHLYHFTSDDARAVLDAYQVDGHLVCTASTLESISIPEPVQDVLACYDSLRANERALDPERTGSTRS